MKIFSMKLPQINIKNRRAAFDYELLDTYTAGIVLTGTEIKYTLGKSRTIRYILLFQQWRTMGQKYVYCRVFLWDIQ